MKPLPLKSLLIFSCLVLGLSSCKKEEGSDGVLIRVRNGSTYSFTALVVQNSRQGGLASYGALAPGQISGYTPHTEAYSYSYAKATINGKDVSFVPDDYVGEKLLEPGRYTYVVEVINQADGTPKSLWVRLERP